MPRVQVGLLHVLRSALATGHAPYVAVPRAIGHANPEAKPKVMKISQHNYTII